MNFSQKHMYLIVEGSQSAEFLQGQITIDVDKISDKEYTPACVCNNKGRVIATFWIKSSENGFIISILEELTDFFEDHMKKYIPFFKTEIKRLVKNSPEKELSSEEWMKFLIKKEIVEVNAHISSKFTPHELNYHNNNLIDFSKGCFNGQEIIARMQYRGKLRFALKVTDNLHTEIIEPSICSPETLSICILNKTVSPGFKIPSSLPDESLTMIESFKTSKIY